MGPFDEDEDFLIDDFALLEQHTLKSSVNKILTILKDSGIFKMYDKYLIFFENIPDYIFRCNGSYK